MASNGNFAALLFLFSALRCSVSFQMDELSCDYDGINTLACPYRGEGTYTASEVLSGIQIVSLERCTVNCLIVLPNRLTPSLYIVQVLDGQTHCNDVVTSKRVGYINDQVCPVSLLPQKRRCFSLAY